ncbi:hypothetical protein IAD21_00287 [Abditibacteriota bacterium]|nr:hypothetical protein IAD21_00287 [Abditibacteriota bacterium]
MINDIFNRLEAQENAFRGSLVLAPVLGGRNVSVRIAGMFCRLQIEFEDKSSPHGFGVLEAISSTRAKWLRPATRAEREKYFSLLPRLRFIALEKSRGGWVAFSAQEGNARFSLAGPAWVREVETGVQAFDTILARFDGTHFWFEAPDTKRSPSIAAFLRESLANELAPQSLHKKGLTGQERAAYALVFYGPPPETEAESVPEFGSPIGPALGEVDPRFDWRWSGNEVEARLARSVAHGGARLVSYIERDGVYSVTYKFGDRTHTSTVRAHDLRVETSGICLSGRDGDFDLASLVGVMQEAARVEPWQFHDYD